MVDGKVYYRSANICKSGCEAIVLSADSLLEIGYVRRDGKGTVRTADNGHCRFGLEVDGGADRDDAAEHDAEARPEDEDPETVRIDAVRARMRAIQTQIVRLEAEMNEIDDEEIDELEMQYEELFNCFVHRHSLSLYTLSLSFSPFSDSDRILTVFCIFCPQRYRQRFRTWSMTTTF